MATFFIGGIVGRRSGGIIKFLRFLPHDATADEAFERAEFAVIFGRDKADGVAHRMRPASAADAMDIILGVHREIVIHHVRNAVHVNAARRDVRGHEHAHDAVLEIVQCAQPLALRAVGMERGRLDAVLFQLPREPVGRVLHAREDQHHVHGRILHQMHKQRRFQMLRHLINELRNRFRRICAAADLDEFGRVLKFVRELFDFGRKARGEKQRLPFLRQRADDVADGRKKTHVQHAVGLIEHKILQRGKIGVAALHQIQQAAGTRNDDLCAGAEGVDLRLFADAAKNRGGAQRKMFAVGPDVFINLHREFARGRKHQRADAAWLALARSARQPGQHWQRERRRFARAGLGNADEVVAGQNRRDGRQLNGRGFGVAGFFDSQQNLWIEAEGAKGHG